MANFDRLNDYLASYDAENERITSSLNNQRLEAIISEKSMDFLKTQEQSGSFIGGGQIFMSGQEQVDKVKEGIKKAKKLKQKIELTKKDLEEKMNQLPSKLKETEETIKDLPNQFQTKLKETQQSIKNIPNKLQEYRSQGEKYLENVKDKVDSFKSKVGNAREIINEKLGRIQNPTESISSSNLQNIILGGEEQEEQEEDEIQPRIRTNVQTNIENQTTELNNSVKSTLENESSKIAKSISEKASESEGVGEGLLKKVSKNITKVGAEEEAESGFGLSEIALPVIGLGLVATGIADIFGNDHKKLPDIEPPILKPPPNYQKMVQSQTTMNLIPSQLIHQNSASF